MRILNNGFLASEQVSTFRYYLERHIELDGKDHAPLAIALVNSVCGNKEERWAQATCAVKSAFRNRAALWSAVEASFVSSTK